jgi:hypothetical protein
LIVTEKDKPPIGGMGGCIHDWVRSRDPFHADAFPADLKHAALVQGERRSGWLALDAWGNPIGFVADGDEYPPKRSGHQVVVVVTG